MTFGLIRFACSTLTWKPKANLTLRSRSSQVETGLSLNTAYMTTHFSILSDLLVELQTFPQSVAPNKV